MMVRTLNSVLIPMLLVTVVGSVSGMERLKILEIVITCNGKSFRFTEG